MTQAIQHPLARSTWYTADPDGTVRVERGGKWGRFDDSGQWLEGEVRVADPQMCRFLASTWVMARATRAGDIS
jgi:hypothetical protein